ncbi:MAG TPA: helix-turn-helix transcriptional regulator [Gemmatimonadales bacterium]|nr:helix-turn-helix transcriptional regulator [Gemmatimonadales bacterium]
MRQVPILAAVTEARLFRLCAVDPERYEWLPARTWPDAVAAIRTRAVDLAVVDPLLGQAPRSVEIARLHQHFPSLPLVIYTALTPDTAGVLLELGRAGIRRVLFERFDDAPASIRRTLRAELDSSASQVLIQQLSQALPGLPEPVRPALEAALRSPADCLTVSALARRAQITRRTCERSFARAGLPSPKVVMLVARVLYAHRLLLDPGYTIEDVALKLGYATPRTLQAHFREVFGLTAGDLRMSVSPEEALELVVRRYVARERAAAS